MICELKKKDIEELKTTNILPQNPFWGRVKSNQGFIPKAFELSISKDLLSSDANVLEKMSVLQQFVQTCGVLSFNFI